MVERFGGHAAAAGLTLRQGALEEFRAAFEAVAREWLGPADLARRIDTDGELAPADITVEFAQMLREQVWGQGFPEPRYSGRFSVESQRVVGEKHLKLTLGMGSRRYGAIRFGSAEPAPGAIDAVYRLDVNEFQGARSLQLVVEHLAASG